MSSEESWECVSDSIQYVKKGGKKRIFEFLVSLKSEIDDLRSRVLR